MTLASPPELRPITSADRGVLERFSCRSWAEPWTADVEASIRCLADELPLSEAIAAQGLWAGEALVALVVWRVIPTTTLCESLILAVETGHRRQGYARRLKTVELRVAREAGCRAVISKCTGTTPR